MHIVQDVRLETLDPKWCGPGVETLMQSWNLRNAIETSWFYTADCVLSVFMRVVLLVAFYLHSTRMYSCTAYATRNCVFYDPRTIAVAEVCAYFNYGYVAETENVMPWLWGIMFAAVAFGAVPFTQQTFWAYALGVAVKFACVCGVVFMIVGYQLSTPIKVGDRMPCPSDPAYPVFSRWSANEYKHCIEPCKPYTDAIARRP